MRLVLFILLFYSVPFQIAADVVFLKSGKVYEFVQIQDVSANGILFETSSKEKFRITTGELLRLRYGQDEIETVSIFTKDGILIDGYLIDQDTKMVLIRRQKDNIEEETIQKSNIQQMSKNKIVVVYPELTTRLGVFYPWDSGGANLGPGFVAILGFFINPPFLPSSKLGIEAGYIHNISQNNPEMKTHMIPLLLNFQYLLKLNAGSAATFDIAPRVCFGGTYFIFIDGEGGEFQNILPTLSAGVGMYLTVIPRKLFLNLFSDYVMMLEGENLLNSIMGSLSVQYRL